MMPLTRSRSSLVRWRPPRLAGGISGLTSAHSSSVRSLGYRSSSRLCRARVAVFHMSHLTKRWRPGNHGRSSGFKSSFLVARQPTHMTRKPPGRTLKEILGRIDQRGRKEMRIDQVGGKKRREDRGCPQVLDDGKALADLAAGKAADRQNGDRGHNVGRNLAVFNFKKRNN